MDEGVSGARDRCPALDALLAAVRRREVSAVVVTKLDRMNSTTDDLIAAVRRREVSAVVVTKLDRMHRGPASEDHPMSQVALYARVSTTDPHAEVQLADLRAYASGVSSPDTA